MLKRFNKKGFTLVELLITIFLLGLVAAIIIYNMTNVSKSSKETEYERYVASVKSAASVYADLNSEAFNDLYVSKSYIYIKAGDLISNGVLDEGLKNPYTEEKIGFDEIIKANLDTTSGAITFEYPLDNEDKETFLVAISDYVIWGEKYDCMQGSGSYRLALSAENGDLIMLDNKETIEKYNFTCKMPNDFNPEVSGSYDILYTWITESGTRKSATRTLRVLPKVVPSFKTNYTDQDYLSGVWFTPVYNENKEKDNQYYDGAAKEGDCAKGWKCLAYTPYIEGAGSDTVQYTITKKNKLKENAKVENVTPVNAQGELEFVNDYQTYKVDDGAKEYTISVKIQGHYDSTHYYEASNTVTMRSKLIIPEFYIQGGSEIWGTERNFDIIDTYSPVGLKYYEYKVLNDDDEKPNSEAIVDEEYKFPRTTTHSAYKFGKPNGETNATLKTIDVFDQCVDKARTYKRIAFRAINDEDYAGEWTVANAYITNELILILQVTSDGCNSCASCCLKSGESCYYCDKNKYFKVDGKTFIVLETDGESIMATYDGDVKQFSPLTTKNGFWSVKTCDGIFSKNYEYDVASIRIFRTKLTDFVADIQGYEKYLNLYSWPDIGTAYAGTVTVNYFNKYKNALIGNTSHKYWTTSVYQDKFQIQVDTPYRHGNKTTKYHSYFYVYAYNKKSKDPKKWKWELSKDYDETAYGGKVAYAKAIVNFKPIYICKGDSESTAPYGSSSNPYIIASRN